MKYLINKKLNKVILLMIILILSLCSFVYAEDSNVSNSDNSNTSGIYYTGEKGSKNEVSNVIDVSGGWKGYYKNFIVELGAVKFSFYNKDGSLFNSATVLPPDDCFVQAENDKGVKRVGDTLEFYKAYG